MRCLVALNNKPDVIFIHCDDDFKELLSKEAHKLYGAEQLVESDEPDLHVASFYFSYWVTSQNVQASAGNPYVTIEGQDGLFIAFHKFDDINVIVVEEQAMQEGAMTRCAVFEKLVRLHFGPATSFLKSDDKALRHALWDQLRLYLDGWDALCGDKQVEVDTDFTQNFLFQAVEHLHVNEALKQTSSRLMERALESAQKMDRLYSQALLVVNGKLLYSHCSQYHRPLVPSDLLFVLLIAHCALPKCPVSTEDFFAEEEGDQNGPVYHQQTLFIKSSAENPEHFLPCTMTALCIRAGIVLILLAEVNAAAAPNICRAIAALTGLQSQIEVLADSQDTVFNTGPLVDSFNSMKGTMDFCIKRMRPDMTRFRDLAEQWEKIEKDWRGTISISSKLGKDNKFVYQLDNNVCEIITDFRRLYYTIYCIGRTNSNDRHICDIYQNLKIGLRDSASYLLVKAQRNFTLSNHLAEYPGIVHFLYINRTRNRVIVPCLSGDGDSNRYFKKIVRNLHQFAQRLLFGGYNQGCMRKGDLLYTYKLWFQNEDKKHIMTEKEPYLPPQGQLSGDVYRAMTDYYFPKKSAVSTECIELMTIYVGDLPVSYVTKQNRKLADSFSSGEFSPEGL